MAYEELFTDILKAEREEDVTPRLKVVPFDDLSAAPSPHSRFGNHPAFS
jgi:hypothetical protein